MFEKEAEELFKKKPLGYEMKPEIEIYKDGFKDGYNKAKEEMQEQGLALQSDMDKTIEQNIALKAQIEKMKCCENCKHSDTECEGYTICDIGHYDDCLSNKIFDHTTDEKDYWEIYEQENAELKEKLAGAERKERSSSERPNK